MVHSKIYECLTKCMSTFAEKTKTYFPSGKNCIRVRQADGQEFIFTYNDPKTWKIETISHFLANMKGVKT